MEFNEKPPVISCDDCDRKIWWPKANLHIETIHQLAQLRGWTVDVDSWSCPKCQEDREGHDCPLCDFYREHGRENRWNLIRCENCGIRRNTKVVSI